MPSSIAHSRSRTSDNTLKTHENAQRRKRLNALQWPRCNCPGPPMDGLDKLLVACRGDAGIGRRSEQQGLGLRPHGVSQRRPLCAQLILGFAVRTTDPAVLGAGKGGGPPELQPDSQGASIRAIDYINAANGEALGHCPMLPGVFSDCSAGADPVGDAHPNH